MTLADWAAEQLKVPMLDATVPVPGGRMVVRRLEKGRIASMGLQLDELLQVEPDEGILATLEQEIDGLGPLRRWLRRLRRPGAPDAGLSRRPRSG